MTMSDKNFDGSTLEHALAELGQRAFAAGRTAEIAIYGGSALLLTLNRQINTGDVDAVFEGNKDFVKKLAAAPWRLTKGMKSSPRATSVLTRAWQTMLPRREVTRTGWPSWRASFR